VFTPRTLLFAAAIYLAVPGTAIGQYLPTPETPQAPTSAASSTAQTAADLALQAQNPFANLTQVQFSNDFYFGAAEGNGFLYNFTLQPIIPFTINDDWNLITRSVFTAASVPDSGSSGRTSGTGDSNIQFYFTPSQSESFIWGFGPVLGVPTASNTLLGSGKWTLGPGFGLVRQTQHWTFVLIVNQSWSVAGNADRDAVSLMTLDPSLSYTWTSGWSLGFQCNSTYDAKASSGERLTVPFQISISKDTTIGRSPFNLSLAVIQRVIAPSGYPSIGLNFTITALFPKE
jgi:hypothetical protein